jgi:RNA polymerase sigma factor (sigma-70 family)
VDCSPDLGKPADDLPQPSTPSGGGGWTADAPAGNPPPHAEIKPGTPAPAGPASTLPASAQPVSPGPVASGSLPTDDDGDVDPILLDLLTRMRAKDRQAVAEFISHYGSRIKRRVRGKLNGAVRRLYDANDMVSTVARRLDQFVRDGRLEADNPRRLWALVGRIADNAAIDKVRIFKRLSETEGPDGVMAAAMADKLREAERGNEGGFVVELDKILTGIKDEKDRKILELWLKGVPHAEIAEILGMTSAAVRKRWQEIKERLRERLGPHMQED